MKINHVLELAGCTPEPLISYLKALGIFRLVAEQKDPGVRAWWQNGSFFLRLALDRQDLERFFLEEYRPTPIASPWNRRFKTGLVKDTNGLDVILSTDGERFARYRETLVQARRIAEQETDKARLLARCRNQFDDDALAWLDAVYVLADGNPKYPPLTSMGGTLGTSSSGDLAMNFAKNLVEALALRVRARKASPAKSPHQRLSTALFQDTAASLISSPGGQFSPGGWGPNASVGFEGDALINPWDFVLMMEGLLTFAGAAGRRLSSGSGSKAVFPFTVDTSAAGYSINAPSEYTSSKAEFWAPLWKRPASFREIRHVAAEGRAQLGRQQALNGAGFARAVAGLGTERGISSFQRFGFVQRTGRDGVLAVPMGRFSVPYSRETDETDLLFELDSWLSGLRRSATENHAPAQLAAALSQIDKSVFEYCRRSDPHRLQNVLIAASQAEKWLGTASVGNKDDGSRLRPLQLSSGRWARAVDDGSPAFRLALAIASIQSTRGEHSRIGPIRENLEPVDASAWQPKWNKDNPSFVWRGASTYSNMLAVVTRRCLEGTMQGQSHPPLASLYSAPLSDVTSFLNGCVDERRMESLILPLSFMPLGSRAALSPPASDREPLSVLPVAYAAMKLTLVPTDVDWFTTNLADIRMEPSMLAMLRAGRIRDAYRIAYRRLKATGLRPLTATPSIADRSEYGYRLAAALLFPLSQRDFGRLAECALHKPAEASDRY